jgi:hypothetical protein
LEPWIDPANAFDNRRGTAGAPGADVLSELERGVPGAEARDHGVGLMWMAAGGSFVAHLDTGANRTNLYPDSVALLSEGEKASIHMRQTTTGGAGGVLADNQKHIATLAAGIGGVDVRLSEIPVEERLGNSGARLGMDYLRQLRILVLDFDRMSILAERRRAR